MGIRVKISLLVVATQAVMVLIITAAIFVFIDISTALGALVGGAIGMLATTLFSLRVFWGQFEWSPERFLQRFYRAEMQKLGLISILIFCAIKWIGMPGLPLMLTCAAVLLLASWLVLLFRVP